jgi:hypothetical protein
LPDLPKSLVDVGDVVALCRFNVEHWMQCAVEL